MSMQVLTLMAEATAKAEHENPGFFEALGIDWKLLVLQTIAFLVLLWFLGKFVYPPLTKMLDKREADIEAGVQAAQAAEKKAEAAKEDVEKLLKQARSEASDIVATAKEEATAMTEASDKKAKTRAERIVAEAGEQIEKDVLAARKTLRDETLNLVAVATEKVVGKTVDAKVDQRVIADAVKEAK
jgi:F-type H+-transporting ATPase subunit b